VRVDLPYGDRGVKGVMRAADRDIEAGMSGVKTLATGDQVDMVATPFSPKCFHVLA
jgi:histidyl-tRNA synthetase